MLEKLIEVKKMNAYVLLSLVDASEREILNEFLDMPEVEDAHILFGEWDLILKIKGENPDAIATFVMDKVRKRDGVELTSTLIVAK
ncbi:hypothetical protein COV13_00345 [Candidatus Woesearchaeota archaeon CG10_big_fil_rev_8_21_14_0_10_32_9]|nr:MAG: hypothetical protein COV13_00345 [Candidatus Woesearchaeota archaeon CG10_big_fil_rev_8_21_14_0_10_32_9]